MKQLLISTALLVLLPIISDAADVLGHFNKAGTYVASAAILEPKDRDKYKRHRTADWTGNYS